MTDTKHGPRIFFGWYVLAASFLILFLNTGGRYIIGVMVKPIGAEFGWSRGAISSAIFLNMAVYALAVIVTGRLYDRYGPKWVIAGSTILFSTGYALMAGMDSLWEFLLYFGVINAAGLGGTSVPIFGSIIGNWFEKRRGLAVSLAMAGSCLGQFFLIPVFSDMVVTSGWRATSFWIAVLSLGLNLILAFGVIRGDPEKFGLRPYGSPADPYRVGVGPEQLSSQDDARSSQDDARSPQDDARSPQDDARSPFARRKRTMTRPRRDLSLSEAMHTRSFWLFTAFMFICGSADSLVTTHLVPMVTDYGISTEVASSMLAWLGLLSLPGILLAGPASDAIGNKLPIAITFALRVVLFAMIFWLKGPIPFWVFSLGFGFTLLVTAPLTPTLVTALYGVTNIGFISGFVTTVHMLGGGLWTYLGGVLFDITGDYDLAFIISAVMAAVALICTLLIREERHLPPHTEVEEQ